MSAAASVSRPLGATSRSRFSSRSRSAVSGVRSWCDASATNSSCERTSVSSFAAVLVQLARRVGEPRAARRPRVRAHVELAVADRAAPRARAAASGRETERASSKPAPPARRRARRRRGKREPVPVAHDASSVEVGYVIADGAEDAAGRGDRHRDVEQAACRGVGECRIPRDRAASAAAISGRERSVARRRRSVASRRCLPVGRRSRRGSPVRARYVAASCWSRARRARLQRVLRERRRPRDRVALDLRRQVLPLGCGR